MSMLEQPVPTLRAARSRAGGASLLVTIRFFGAKQRAKMYDQLARATRRGTLGAYLRKRAEFFEAERNPRGAIYRAWAEGVNEGTPFFELIQPFIPAAEAMILKAATEGGRLPEGFETAKYAALSMERIKSTIVGEAVYPVMLLFGLIAAILVMSYTLIPTMMDIAPVETWPSVSRGLYHFTQFIRGSGLLVTGLGIALAIAVVLSLPRWAGERVPGRAVFDRFAPVYGLYKQVQAGIFMIVMSGMLAAGSPFGSALRSLVDIASPWMRSHINRMTRLVDAGQQPTSAIDIGLLDREVMGEIHGYSEAGSLGEALQFLGTDIVEVLIERVRKAMGLMRVLLMLLVGVGIVWGYGAMFLVVIQVFQAATRGSAAG